MSLISPTEDGLTSALQSLRISHPTLGAAKLLPLLLEQNPSWTVSEKRLRKTLAAAGLTAPTTSSAVTATGSAEYEYPSSKVNDHLDLEKWTRKVKVVDFGREKGKGLVATEPIKEGEHIWVEDPFVMSPEIELEDLQRTGQACTHCTRPIAISATPPVPCKCAAMFCNRLCYARGAPAHAFLCPTQNPASIAFLEHARNERWKSAAAWARVTALLFSIASKGPSAAKELDDTIHVIRGLAGLSLEKRVKVLTNWQASEAASRALWKRTHTLLVQAFQKPPDPPGQKALTRLKGKHTLPASIEEELLSYDGFLLGLGKMSLNMEAHGGLYALHSHVNHSCSPNVSVRHITKNQIPRITVVARAPSAPGANGNGETKGSDNIVIQPGEELLAAYVDPGADVWTRRRELREWGFGECRCERCVKEEAEFRATGGEGEAGENRMEKVELEDEIRGFLGL